MYVAMATAVHMDYTLPLKQVTSFQMLLQRQLGACVVYLCSLCNCIHIRFTDYIMLYSVQLKNMYSYLNSSLKLSDIVRGLSCQQSLCNLLSLYKLIIIIPFIFILQIFIFFIHIIFSLIPYDADDPQGLMCR